MKGVTAQPRGATGAEHTRMFSIIRSGNELGHMNVPAAAIPGGIEKPVNADELSLILDLHPETIRRWAREGKIPYLRLGHRRIVFLPSKIKAWLESRSGYTVSAGRAAITHESEAA